VTQEPSGDDDSRTDAVDSFVRGLVDFLSDPGEKAVPHPSTDEIAVIRNQLVENTGAHLLDSGSHYGRAWEENRDNPPWERPSWDVSNDYVTHNVYDLMERRLDRDEMAVALETALYAFGHSGDRSRESWLRTMEDFAEATVEGQHYLNDLLDIGVPREAAEMVLGFSHECSDQPPMTGNTYNGECHTLSQCLQFTTFGGPYAEYVVVQVHGGCDIRGGYTAPRVYRQTDPVHPGELHFRCSVCDWSEAESCLYRSDELLYQRTVDRRALEEELRDHADDEVRPSVLADYAAEAADDAEGDDSVDGGVFHVGGGCGGRVTFF